VTLSESNQAGLSKLEKRTDMLLNTLRRYLNAMGAALELKPNFLMVLMLSLLNLNVLIKKIAEFNSVSNFAYLQ